MHQIQSLLYTAGAFICSVYARPRAMHVINAVWWRHAYVFSICLFFQSLWITLQLRHHWSSHWYGIMMWLYLAVVYWAWHNYALMVMRGDHNRHTRASSHNVGYSVSQLGVERASTPHNERDSWDEGDELDDLEEQHYDADSFYLNDGSEQHYTKQELHANAAYGQSCVREAGESTLSYRLRRALTMQQWVRLSVLALAVVQTVLLVVKLENADAFDWWVWWLVASIMSGVVMLFSVVGAFWVPFRAWYIHAYIKGQREAVLRTSGVPSSTKTGYVDDFTGNSVRGVQY